ncbi:MAG: HDOD domain-containing protein [Deltaproteobacteria bacterium]|nr:HDOD domain-containing protein [Deltaproteobacteria bacterium]
MSNGGMSASGDVDVAAALRSEVGRRIAAGKIDLPLLPQVASQVLMLAGNVDTDAAQLSGLIHRDPALAGQVLRIANSPSYMPRMPIVSLQQAVARLGLNTVTEIALVASMQTSVFKVPGYEADLKRMWRHAVASGIFAKEIARIRRSNVEAAFLCGLLHAVGKPALLQVVADVEQSLHATMAGPNPSSAVSHDSRLRAVVWELLDELHTGVGLRIAEVWGLPRPVVAAIATYGSYQNTPGFMQEAVITCLADRLATDLTEPDRFDADSLRDHPVFGHLNLYPDDVVGLLAKRAKISEIVDSMTS